MERMNALQTEAMRTGKLVSELQHRLENLGQMLGGEFAELAECKEHLEKDYALSLQILGYATLKKAEDTEDFS